MNKNCVWWMFTLVNFYVFLRNFFRPLPGCEAFSTWKRHGDQEKSIWESMIFSRKAPEPKCINCVECSVLDQVITKGRCRPRPPRPRPPPPPPPPPKPIPSTERTTTTTKPEPGRCQIHGKSACRCQRDVCCAFNVATKRCTDLDDYCLGLTFAENECRKPNKYYAFGGVLCHNRLRGGNCANSKTFLAVNVNGAKVTGSDGITYQKGSTLKIMDPEDTRNYESLTDSHEDLLGLSHKGDRCLYTSYIYSKNKDNCNCLSTPIQKLRDGRYEVILKFVDPTKVGRTFDVKLNGITVLKEFRILRYTSVNYSPLEAIIQFEVQDDRKTLILRGHPPSKIKKCKILLSFCRGECWDYKAYVINAIAVLQYPYVSGEPPPPPPPPPPTPPPELSEEEKCRQVGSGLAKCKELVFCRFSASHRNCQHKTEFCYALEFDIAKDCVLPGNWYSVDGDVCKVYHNLSLSVDPENCVVKDVVAAVNLGGDGDVVGSDGFTYTSTPEQILDPNNILSYNRPRQLEHISGINPEDQPIYTTFLVGSGRPQQTAKFRIRLKEDGRYQLRLKFAEHIYRVMGQRRFTIKLNGKEILKDFDILSIAKFGEGKDVLLNFEVTDNLNNLVMTGYPKICPIEDETLAVEVSVGNPYPQDNGPFLNGYLLVQLGTPMPAPPPPPPPISDSEQCNRAGGDIVACRKFRFCRYSVDSSECRHEGDFCADLHSIQMRNCLRPGTFYSVDGDICLTPGSSISLNSKCRDPVAAVNFGGPTTTGSDGYLYEAQDHKSADIVDPYGLLSSNTPSRLPDISGIQVADQDIYNTFVVGNGESGSAGKCARFPIKLYKDGDYELTLKFAEHVYTEKGKRQFTIRLNGKEILKEFDILSIAKFGEGKDVLLDFAVTGGLKTLTIMGYRGTWSMHDETLFLEICSGQTNSQDNGPILTGFSLARICPHAISTSSSKHASFCSKAFNGLNGTMYLTGGLCQLINAHYSFNGELCFTGYTPPLGPMKDQCLSGFGTGKGFGLNLNGEERLYVDIDNLRYNYRDGTIPSLEDNYSDDRNLEEFVTPGATLNYLQELWHCYGVGHAMRTWYVANGDPGRCLSIRLDKLYENLEDGEYFLVTMIPDTREGLGNGQEREFSLKINGVTIANRVNPIQLAKEVRDAAALPPGDDEYDVPGEVNEAKIKVGEVLIVTYVKMEGGQVHLFDGSRARLVPVPRSSHNTYNFQICNGISPCGGKSHNFAASAVYMYPARYFES